MRSHTCRRRSRDGGLLLATRPSWGGALLAVLAIPLNGDPHWHALSFNGKTANEVTFSEKELRIRVRGSASPLFYHFDGPLELKSVFVEGRLSALPHLPPGKKEGEEGADDLPLRFGLVREGEKTLGWLERLFAPQWLKQLSDILPDRSFGSVEFLTVSQALPPGTRRIHPMSRCLTEEVVRKVDGPGPFSFERVFSEGRRTVGLWLQVDGDDTQSDFDVALNSILLTTAAGENPRAAATPTRN